MEDLKMLKFLLQPLAENSLQHAFGKMKEINRITLTAWEDGDDIIFQLRDNGVGMNTEIMEKLNKELAKTDTGTLVNHVDKGIGRRDDHDVKVCKEILSVQSTPAKNF